jgi:cytohesin
MESAIMNDSERDVLGLLQADPELARKENSDGPPLCSAVKFNRPRIVEILLEAGADPNARNKLGESPLYVAVQFGDRSEIITALVEAGAEPDAPNKFGWTPLHGAAKLGKLENVKLLVEKGANINSKTPDGSTPLDFAMNHGNHHTSAKRKKVADYLKQNGGTL